MPKRAVVTCASVAIAAVLGLGGCSSAPSRPHAFDPIADQPSAAATPGASHTAPGAGTKADAAQASGGTGSAAAKPSAAPSASASKAPRSTVPRSGKLSKSQSKAAYQQLVAPYVALSAPLDNLVDDPGYAVFHADVLKAKAGFDGYVKALQGYTWPAAVQPYVNSYLALATTTGRAMFARAVKAKKPADTLYPGLTHDQFALEHAESVMRAHLGIST